MRPPHVQQVAAPVQNGQQQQPLIAASQHPVGGASMPMSARAMSPSRAQRPVPGWGALTPQLAPPHMLVPPPQQAQAQALPGQQGPPPPPPPAALSPRVLVSRSLLSASELHGSATSAASFQPGSGQLSPPAPAPRGPFVVAAASASANASALQASPPGSLPQPSHPQMPPMVTVVPQVQQQQPPRALSPRPGQSGAAAPLLSFVTAAAKAPTDAGPTNSQQLKTSATALSALSRSSSREQPPATPASKRGGLHGALPVSPSTSPPHPRPPTAVLQAQLVLPPRPVVSPPAAASQDARASPQREQQLSRLIPAVSSSAPAFTQTEADFGASGSATTTSSPSKVRAGIIAEEAEAVSLAALYMSIQELRQRMTEHERRQELQDAALREALVEIQSQRSTSRAIGVLREDLHRIGMDLYSDEGRDSARHCMALPGAAVDRAPAVTAAHSADGDTTSHETLPRLSRGASTTAEGAAGLEHRLQKDLNKVLEACEAFVASVDTERAERERQIASLQEALESHREDTARQLREALHAAIAEGGDGEMSDGVASIGCSMVLRAGLATQTPRGTPTSAQRWSRSMFATTNSALEAEKAQQPGAQQLEALVEVAIERSQLLEQRLDAALESLPDRKDIAGLSEDVKAACTAMHSVHDLSNGQATLAADVQRLRDDITAIAMAAAGAVVQTDADAAGGHEPFKL
eukprot:TRINITY_DN70990_c0_g1_i1.p1 TRINITY_DN70990_c0_g1~~TRINITY_DN70990_c0_g1_i1.p1  ORF type:complete len:695 (-),score=172.95 TRINITY_DN70990_c0_g1_i1:156-2240(-)